ncbi:MAG: hypothetical protein R8M46_06035 [Ghiorsea sp.]
MSWKKTFEIAGVVVAVESDDTACNISLQAIISLYHEVIDDTAPDILFSIREDVNKVQLLLNQHQLLWQASDYRDIAPALEIHIYRQVLQRTYPDFMSIHASTVNSLGKTCMFAGVSGAGKSSLCTAALLAGARYFTDEFSLLGENGFIYPFPRPVQWDEVEHPAFSAAQMLDSKLFGKEEFSFLEAGSGHLVTSHLWLPKHVQHEALPLHAVVFPCYRADNPSAELQPMRRAQAIMSLPEHIHQHYSVAGDIQQLNQRLPQTCKFYSLEFSDAHAAWKLAAEKINKV